MDEDKVAFNLILFKRLGFYHLFKPKTVTFLNRNLYRFAFATSILVMMCLSVYGLLGFVFEMEDTIDDIALLQILYVYLLIFLSLFKMSVCLLNADKIWELLDVTQTNFLTSYLCTRYIDLLHRYKDTSTKITNVVCAVVIVSFFLWAAFPLLCTAFHAYRYDGGNQRYENIINLRFPVSINSYNYFYIVLYMIEVIIAIFIVYAILLTDILLISISYVIIAQYEIHVRAFGNIGHELTLQYGNEEKCDGYVEDLKSIIKDQQKLNQKLKKYYSIIKPIIIWTVVATSGSIIMLSYSFFLICILAESIDILNVIKLFNSLVFFFSELYFHCYLLDIINEKKESVTFGIYSCNWTMTNLKFKKMLLLTMRMNNANKPSIKITPNSFINLNFFAYVILQCYNIISVLLKIRSDEKDYSN